MTFTRKMSARERMRLWFPNINVVVIAKIKGDIDHRKFSQSLEKISKIHPLTRVKAIVGENGEGVFTNRNVQKIPIFLKQYNSPEDIQQAVNEEIRIAWDFRTGPLLRLTILSSEDEHHLVFCGHHAICDGRSFIYLIRDLLSDYSGKIHFSTKEMKIPASEEERLPPGVKESFLAKIFISSMNKKWMRKNIQFSQQDYNRMHESFWKKRQTCVILESITEDEFSPFIKQCRLEECSVNSAIYVAFLLAQLHVQHELNERVLIPIDLRSYLSPPLEDVFGYFASALVIKNVIDGKIGFWETVRNFEKEVNRNKKIKNVFSFINTTLFEPSLLDAAIFAQNGNLEDEQALKLSAQIFNKLGTKLMVSNLGKIDIPKHYGELELLDIVPPILISGNSEKVIEFVTFGEHMNFSITHDPRIVTTQVVENVFTRVKNTIILFTK